jgi:hypothetical protein
MFRTPCTCALCAELYRNMKFVFPVGVQERDVRAAFGKGMDPYIKLLRFVTLHRLSELDVVQVELPTQLVSVLQRFSNDFMRLNVRGLGVDDKLRKLVDEKWERSVRGAGSARVCKDYGIPARSILIGKCNPVAVVTSTTDSIELFTNGQFYFSLKKYAGKRAIVYRMPEYSESAIRAYTRVLATGERRYVYADAEYVHATNKCSVWTPFSFHTSDMRLHLTTIMWDDLPQLPEVSPHTYYFNQFVLMGESYKIDGKEYKNAFID